MPRLSVIIPVFNSEKYLNTCVGSVLRQSFKDIELILVDDGSTDSSAFLCDEWATKDARVLVIHKANQGQGIARNCGINAARGELVAFVDSDDYIEQDMYETLLNAALGMDLVLCQIKRVFDNGQSIIINDIKNTEIIGMEAIELKLLLPLVGVLSKNEGQINASSCRGVYKKQIICDNEVFFESERTYLSEDLLFNIKYLLCCSKIKCIATPFYSYRDNQGSFSTSYTADKLARIDKLYKKATGLFCNMQQEYATRMAATVLGHISVCVKQIVANKQVLGHAAAKQLIKDIASSEVCKTALHGCKYYKLQAPLNVFCFLIDTRQLWLLIILIQIFLKFDFKK